MDAKGILMMVALLAAFAMAALLVPVVAAKTRRRTAAERSQRRLIGEAGPVSALLRNGIGWMVPLTAPMRSIGFAERFFRDAEAAVLARGIATTAENLCSVWCAAAAALAVVGSIVGSSPVFGCAAAACFAVGSRFFVEHEKETRTQQLREGVPDVLRSMSVCFHAGLSLQQTLRQIATEVDGPLATLFGRAANELEAGGTAEEALRGLRRQASVPELAFVAVALEIQHMAGGSMQQVLDAARDSVESEIELRRSLRVQTAQAKLSARVVTAMPFVLVALFSLITENFLAPFFTSVFGLVLLGVAVCMQTAGVLTVRSMLKVEVD